MTTKTTTRRAATKVCTSCERRKPLDSFPVANGRPRRTCKPCTQQARKAYYQANRETAIARAAIKVVQSRELRHEMIARMPKPERCEICSAKVTTPTGCSKSPLLGVLPDGTSLSALANTAAPLEVFEAALFSSELQWVCTSCNLSSAKSDSGPREALEALIVRRCSGTRTVAEIIDLVRAEREASEPVIRRALWQLKKRGELVSPTRGLYQAAR